MKRYQYLIIGGGIAADAAVRGIRAIDEDGTIGIISAEVDPPYIRPKLSKGLWKGEPVEEIWKNTQELNVDLFLGQLVTKIDTLNNFVRDEDGGEYVYDKLLITTGGSPKHLPFGDEYILYYRNFQDYQRLREESNFGDKFLVIGGSFIGSELAAALTMVGKKVTMVFPESAIAANNFPQGLANYISDYYRDKGVEILAGEEVKTIQKQGEKLVITTNNNNQFDVDGIVAGIGIKPNVELAKQAGIKVDNGIVVNDYLQTSSPDIYAAGDVANFYHSALEKHIRVEHEDNALIMGKIAGKNMAGETLAYTHVPMFYSDLFDLGYEAVGQLNSELDIIEDWQDGYKKGVVYYLSDGRVRGVLLWNVWDQVDTARELMKEEGPFKENDLKGRIS
ncbi:MAG: pyridine nucleotide-disulfide oxidoreductase [Anaerolineaceae bacterium]|nr:pyridine nucleotide-disulfide oxidoreductase [Anaerolineaceae bacterium]